MITARENEARIRRRWLATTRVGRSFSTRDCSRTVRLMYCRHPMHVCTTQSYFGEASSAVGRLLDRLEVRDDKQGSMITTSRRETPTPTKQTDVPAVKRE